MLDKPLVTCIMPTANRRMFLTFAIRYFLEQDYSNAELIIIDDGIKSNFNLIPSHPRISYFYYDEPLGTIGIKRNIACEKAKGEIIVHWDDDDYYASDWITNQVDALINSGADITGLNSVNFYSVLTEKSFIYQDTSLDKPWLCGATLVFKKSLWKKYHFVNLQVGEDSDFLLNSGGSIYASNHSAKFTAFLHAKNTSIKHLDSFNPVGWIIQSGNYK